MMMVAMMLIRGTMMRPSVPGTLVGGASAFPEAVGPDDDGLDVDGAGLDVLIL